jgi:acetyl-CoA C-acetyltransferase
MKTDIVIVAATRTPIGRLGGSLSTVAAHKLGGFAIAEALKRAQIESKDVSDVILGQVLTAGTGQNPARQAAVAAGIPYETTALGVNQVCGSGLRAVAMGYQALQCGDADIVVAGGQESMSQAPHCASLRAGTKFGDTLLKDTLVHDGLTDVFHGYAMGITAENVAQRWHISRQEQDQLAYRSQRKAALAQKTRRFVEEIVPIEITGRNGVIRVEEDESIRQETTLESLAQLRPAFQKEGGTVTAGNASGINDGAAVLILMRAEEAARRKLPPLARIVSWATAGIDPAIMGMGPVAATRRVLDRAGWHLKEVDLIEANEAFAAQGCAVGQELEWDEERVNVNGGAIALGHPIGASGARILVTLVHELRRRNARRGLATLCIGGGMGIALCVERS